MTARFLTQPKPVSPRPRGRRLGATGLLVPALLALSLASCAYYNTYYLARKYYYRATAGDPYSVDGASQANAGNFNKSIDYSKKVLAQYPKSKWVDDAYLMWARSLLGKDDPIQTVNMLQDFTTRFPKSGLDAEALFFLGVGNRQARRPTEALVALEEFLHRAPKHDLVPNALLERARALTALERHAEAADAAGALIDRYPKSPLLGRALALRAEARLESGSYEQARADFRTLGTQAADDEQRLNFLLREADCLEAGRSYDQELVLLRDALSHEPEVPAADTTGGKRPVAPTSVAAQRWGRLLVRYGSAQLLAGKLEEALASYGRVTRAYPRNELAAEAQYRIGFALETVAEDFENARVEYGRVREVLANGPSATLAGQRLTNLDRLAQYRTAGGDTLQKGAEAAFLLAELYLFTHDKPERALEEYRRIATTYDGTPYAAKALNAEAWVLSRKLERKAEAESLFWRVVRQYPATEEQLAARDYLEAAGRKVPDSLIKFPKPKPPPRDTAAAVPGPGAAASTPAAPFGPLAPDSMRIGPPRPPGAFHLPPGAFPPGIRDSIARRDSTSVRDTTAAPADTTRHHGGRH